MAEGQPSDKEVNPETYVDDASLPMDSDGVQGDTLQSTKDSSIRLAPLADSNPSSRPETATLSPFEKTSASDSRLPTSDAPPDVGNTQKDVEAQGLYDETADLPPAVPVPRSKRRGLLAFICLIAEVEDPKHYDRRKKWWITSVVSFAAILAPLGSNIILCIPPSSLRGLSLIATSIPGRHRSRSPRHSHRHEPVYRAISCSTGFISHLLVIFQ